MVKKGKGGADIVLAPIVASGLLATATKLYQDMVDEQKKKTRRGGNAEVEAFAKDDLDLFTAKNAALTAPTQEGGKKRKSRKPKRGGEGEEIVAEEAQVMEGGKKRKSRKPKRGGEGVLEEVAEETPVMEGGKKRKSRKPKRGGEGVLEEVAEETPVMEGGKKRKSRKPKRGGEGVLEEISEVLEGGKAKKRSYRKKKGGDYASVDAPLAPGSVPPQPPVPVVDASKSPTGEAQPPAQPTGEPTGQAGGKGKRGKKSGKKRGGNAELLGLYESQLGGIVSNLNNLARG